jgi:hypothetical protein
MQLLVFDKVVVGCGYSSIGCASEAVGVLAVGDYVRDLRVGKGGGGGGSGVARGDEGGEVSAGAGDEDEDAGWWVGLRLLEGGH